MHAVLLCDFTSLNAAVTTTFTDFDFETSDYAVTVLNGSPKADGYTLSNVGGELRVRMPLEFSGSALFIGNTSFVADPGVLGALESIDVAFNAGVLNGNAAVAAMLMQGGDFFYGGTVITRSDDFDVSYSFTSLDGLEFSAGSEPIGIGILTSANGATFDVNFRIDEFTATVTSVPEPSALLSCCVLGAMVFMRRRKK